MKLYSKLAILGVVAGLSAASAVIAEEVATPVVMPPEVTPPEVTPPEEPVVEEPTADPSDNETPPADDKVTEPEEPGDVEVLPYPGGEVPIDWVTRGSGGENPGIFYNMAGGGPHAAGEPSHGAGASDEAGKDEAATATEAKTVAPIAPITKVKKGPVALVKGARVFLRH